MITGDLFAAFIVFDGDCTFIVIKGNDGPIVLLAVDHDTCIVAHVDGILVVVLLVVIVVLLVVIVVLLVVLLVVIVVLLVVLLVVIVVLLVVIVISRVDAGVLMVLLELLHGPHPCAPSGSNHVVHGQRHDQTDDGEAEERISIGVESLWHGFDAAFSIGNSGQRCEGISALSFLNRRLAGIDVAIKVRLTGGAVVVRLPEIVYMRLRHVKLDVSALAIDGANQAIDQNKDKKKSE